MAEADPQVGDPVILRGRIKSLDEGVALIEVCRSYPAGGTVAVQCGALELDESEHDHGRDPYREAAVEDRIREAMAEAQDHPGRIVITCTQHGMVNCPCLSAPAGGSAQQPPARPPCRTITRRSWPLDDPYPERRSPEYCWRSWPPRHTDECGCGHLVPSQADITPIGWQGAAQHTYTMACDGFHAPGPCPPSQQPVRLESGG